MSTAPAPLQAPPPPPRASGNWIWWLLGGAGALVVLVILSGLFIAGSFIRGVRVDQKRRQVEMRTPAGSLTVEKTDVRDVGLPVYPGSTPIESGGNVTWTTPGDDRVGILAAHYRTAD